MPCLASVCRHYLAPFAPLAPLAPLLTLGLAGCIVDVGRPGGSDGADGIGGDGQDEIGTDEDEGESSEGEGSSSGAPDMGEGEDETEGETDMGEESGETGGMACDALSSWDPWIGGPCEDDLDCGYEGGVCLREDEGFPCGTCTLPCDLYCPDAADAPETFCVEHMDFVEPFAPDQGACLSKCDPFKLPTGGCREGYACVIVDRFSQPGTKSPVCLPQDIAPPKTECQQMLDDAGQAWIPAYIPLDHPDGHPELDCIVEDPVRLYSPIGGVDYRYIESENPGSVRGSCELALALLELGELLQQKDAVEVAHIGTYNCRVIAGTSTLSEHSFGYAIDLGGFTLEGGQYLSVYDDWEDGVDEPVTFEGQWLKDLTDERFEQDIFNIILTPEYNAAHDDHFHVDLKPGANFYE